MQTKMILTTDHLTKTYRGQNAVDKLSLAIPQHTVYGLLGANGAGKSTTLKMIAGVVRPTSGKIYYHGAPWQRSAMAEIGALIENPPLYGNLSANENLLVRTTALGLPRARVAEVLQQVGLTGTGNKKAKQFSLGMKQRLGIALALLGSPKLLILDEPTNGLDPLGIQSLRGLIRSLPTQGITVILSSHILSEVEQTADEVGILAHGKLGYQGEMPQETGALEQLFLQVAQAHAPKSEGGVQ